MTDEAAILAFLPTSCLVTVLILATVTDVVAHRIPNVLTAPALGIALIVGTALGGPASALISLAGVAVGLAMLLPLYALGAMGAGDVKLLGVAGAFLGPYGAMIAGLATFMAGAVFGLMWIAWQAILLRSDRIGYAGPVHVGERDSAESDTSNRTFAYAPAIATGVAISMWQIGLAIPTVHG